MTATVQAYHANLMLHANTVYMSTGRRENALIAMNAKDGRYLGFKKPPMRARGFATYGDQIFSLNAVEGMLYLHGPKPAFKKITKSPTYRHIHEPGGQAGLEADTKGGCGCGCGSSKEKHSCSSGCCAP